MPFVKLYIYMYINGAQIILFVAAAAAARACMMRTFDRSQMGPHCCRCSCVNNSISKFERNLSNKTNVAVQFLSRQFYFKTSNREKIERCAHVRTRETKNSETHTTHRFKAFSLYDGGGGEIRRKISVFVFFFIFLFFCVTKFIDSFCRKVTHTAFEANN